MINWSPLYRSPGSHKAIKCVKCLPLTMPDMTTRVTIIPWFPLCITLHSNAGHEICCGKIFPPRATALRSFPRTLLLPGQDLLSPWPSSRWHVPFPKMLVWERSRVCFSCLGSNKRVWGPDRVHPTAAPPDSTGYCKSC